MDPIILAIEALDRAGIPVTRSEEPWLELYYAPGFPELTRNQVFDLARKRGAPEPPDVDEPPLLFPVRLIV